MVLTGKKEQVDSIINQKPSVPLRNKAFRNRGDLRFRDVAAECGFVQDTFSYGAAYGDLDRDGDLDLVINNVNQPSMVFENRTEKIDSAHYLSVQLRGTGANSYAIGAKVKAYVGDQIINRQLIPTRGFQSSIDYLVSIGLGTHRTVDSLVVVWPDRQRSRIERPAIDQILEVDYPTAERRPARDFAGSPPTLFEAVDHDFVAHEEDDFIDFYFERNVPVMVSHDGPRAGLGDVNGDGREDLYIGGAAGQAGRLYLRTDEGWVASGTEFWETMNVFEDTAVRFFDADGDGDLDLFVGSGGNHQPSLTREMQDRLYRNDGQGNFSLAPSAFPTNGMNTSVAAPYDFDGDGDVELGFAGRNIYIVRDYSGSGGNNNGTWSPLWQKTGLDDGSQRTGSTLFDFDGNGTVEVVYSEEENLFIYDGPTGTELFRITSRSGTRTESPIQEVACISIHQNCCRL